MSLTFLHLFYTNIDLEWNYTTCDTTYVNDWKLGRRRVKRSESWPPSFRQSCRQYFITVELNWAARRNLIVKMFLSDIYMKYLVALHHQPHTWNTNLLYLPPSLWSYRHQLVSASIFFIFSCSILATFSLAGLFIRISNRFGCFKMCLFAVFLSNMKMFFYNMNH